MTTEQHYLSKRANWQAETTGYAIPFECKVETIIRIYLEKEWAGQFRVDSHPTDLDQLYLEEDYKLNPGDYAKPAEPTIGDIYWDEGRKLFLKYTGRSWTKAKCGCIPDLKITHLPSGRIYFVECKLQGDAGNAQERACKYATPSVLEAIKARIGANYHPIGYLFSGDLVKSKKYIRELRLSFRFASEHLLLWDATTDTPLEEWVGRVIRPLLEG